jgi:hypothetical protein
MLKKKRPRGLAAPEPLLSNTCQISRLTRTISCCQIRRDGGSGRLFAWSPINNPPRTTPFHTFPITLPTTRLDHRSIPSAHARNAEHDLPPAVTAPSRALASVSGAIVLVLHICMSLAHGAAFPSISVTGRLRQGKHRRMHIIGLSGEVSWCLFDEPVSCLWYVLYTWFDWSA